MVILRYAIVKWYNEKDNNMNLQFTDIGEQYAEMKKKILQ